MRIRLLPLNPTVGALPDNAQRCADAIAVAARDAVDLLVLPELAICGYPPRDLLLVEGFVDACRDEVLALARSVPAGLTVLVGAPWRPPPGAADAAAFAADAPISNAALALTAGELAVRYDKRLLPTYDVFDELRYFRPGDRAATIEVAGVTVGPLVCEDLWHGDDAGTAARYADQPDPVAETCGAGAELLAVLSATPFVGGKGAAQRRLLERHALERDLPIVAVNTAGANDDLVFDGHALALAPRDGVCHVVGAARPFAEQAVTVELPIDRDTAAAAAASGVDEVDEQELLFRALVTGVRDYCRKSGFTDVCLGISGGIDSALVATVAAAAIGGDHVLGVLLPGRYSSPGSIDDARALAANIGCRTATVPIERGHAALGATVEDALPALGELVLGGDPGRPPEIVDENLQSRLRGTLMMAVSNATGALLLTTGNKSEHAVGYATLYGDMNGGLAVISDVLKTDVWCLARWIDDHHERCGFAVPPIPAASIAKPPSAELKPGQLDEDTLPPYRVLDPILALAIDERASYARIVRETGAAPELVRRVLDLVARSEFKRKQLAIGLKVRPIAFGRGRRHPIVQRYRSVE